MLCCLAVTAQSWAVILNLQPEVYELLITSNDCDSIQSINVHALHKNIFKK